MTLDAQKKRLRTMFLITGVCLALAAGAYAGVLKFGHPAFLAAFFVALATGFAVQIWFIVGFARAGRGG